MYYTHFTKSYRQYTIWKLMITTETKYRESWMKHKIKWQSKGRIAIGNCLQQIEKQGQAKKKK